MEVTECFTCECNGHPYPNKSALRQHQARPVHKNWARENEVFDLRCRCKRLENENESLKYVIDMLKNSATRKTTNEHSPKIPSTPSRAARVPKNPATPAHVRTPEPAP